MTGLCPPSPEPLTVETALAQIGALRERAEKAERRIADVIAKLAPEVRGVVPADVVDAVGRVVGECGRMRAEVERLRGVLADAHPMLGRAVECEREHGDLRKQIETLTRERDEARALAKRAEQERDYWRLSAGNAGRMSPNEARAIGAVLRAAERHERDMQATGRTSGVPLRVAVEAWTAAGRPGVPSEDESA